MIVEVVDAIAPGPTDPAISQAELASRERVEGMGDPEALTGS